MDALKQFDPVRYHKLNWNNPDDTRQMPANDPFPFLSEYESGLYWDMQTDLLRLLKSDRVENPISNYGSCFLYLTGWSQSTAYINRTIISFADKNTDSCTGRSLIDGYFAAGGDSTLAPINAYELKESNGSMCQAGTIPVKGMIMSEQPLMTVNTDSESRGANWAEDSDEPGYLFRNYPIAGSSHDSDYNLIQYYQGRLALDLHKIGREFKFEGTVGEPLDLPYEYLFHAALRNLYLWVREQIPAPKAPRMKLVPAVQNGYDSITTLRNMGNMKFEYSRDADGNTMGGIRPAALEFPVGRYTDFYYKNDVIYPLFGTVFPFSAEELKLRYKTLEHYQMLVNQNADLLISSGFLMKDDKESYCSDTVELAKKED